MRSFPEVTYPDAFDIRPITRMTRDLYPVNSPRLYRRTTDGIESAHVIDRLITDATPTDHRRSLPVLTDRVGETSRY